MALSAATIFDYCERGTNPAFWAEPLNAISNGGFVLAGLAGAIMLLRRPPSARLLWHWFFVLNFLAIGVGSFLFHTVPNAQTVQMDTIPIGIFMLGYLAFAMRQFLKLSWFVTGAGLAAFVGAMVAALNIQCWDGHFGFLDNVPPGAQSKCLNGSLGYAPALIAMWSIAGTMAFRRQLGAGLIFTAAVTFVISLTFRSVDFSLCGTAVICGYKTGTHFIWHILNATTLFLLLVAAIKYAVPHSHIIPPRPSNKQDGFAFS